MSEAAAHASAGCSTSSVVTHSSTAVLQAAAEVRRAAGAATRAGAAAAREVIASSMPAGISVPMLVLLAAPSPATACSAGITPQTPVWDW